MGILVKLVIAACVAFGFHYAVKETVASAVKAQLGDQPQFPAAPTITVEPEALRQAMEVGRAVETSAAQRAAIEGAVHRAAVAGAEAQLRQMNRDAARWAVPRSPHIPGMPR
jgi:hypothetical protein